MQRIVVTGQSGKIGNIFACDFTPGAGPSVAHFHVLKKKRFSFGDVIQRSLEYGLRFVQGRSTHTQGVNERIIMP